MLTLRRASTGDAQFLYECRTDLQSMQMSHSTGDIPYDRHCAWLHATINSTGCYLYIAEAGDVPIGYGRLDNDPVLPPAISIVIHPLCRGLGFAAPLITAITHETNSTEILASIKPENEASKRSFAHAGYQYQDTVEQDGNLVELWRWQP